MSELTQRYLAQMPPDQRDRLRAAFDTGWCIETDTQKIRARYKDLDLADAVPREIMYLDLGILIGRLEMLETFLYKEGYREP